MAGACIQKISCHLCGSGDGLQVFQDPDETYNGRCFACFTHFNHVEQDSNGDFHVVEKGKSPAGQLIGQKIPPVSDRRNCRPQARLNKA